MIYLTSRGYGLLKAKLLEAEQKLKTVLSQKGDAYENGGNGWHDNFSFEQLVREEAMLAGEVSSISKMLQESVRVASEPASTSSVTIGCVVTLEDSDGNTTEYEVVGYGESDVNAVPKKIEYLAPIIALFMGGELGEEHAVRMGGKSKTLRLNNIRRAECSL